MEDLRKKASSSTEFPGDYQNIPFEESSKVCNEDYQNVPDRLREEWSSAEKHKFILQNHANVRLHFAIFNKDESEVAKGQLNPRTFTQIQLSSQDRPFTIKSWTEESTILPFFKTDTYVALKLTAPLEIETSAEQIQYEQPVPKPSRKAKIIKKAKKVSKKASQQAGHAVQTLKDKASEFTE